MDSPSVYRISAMWETPNIVYCHYRPERSRKRRPQPPLLCGRIVEIASVKKRRPLLPGVPDDAQRAVIIRGAGRKLPPRTYRLR